jgi:hypothetical protein
MATWPKNCRPADGGWFGDGAKRWNSSRGPKVASSALGPKVPALSGPDTNSQKGRKSWKTAPLGS